MRFYIIMAMVNPGMTIADVQAALHGVAYYRVANNVWIVHNNGHQFINAKYLYNALEDLVHPSGSLFISQLNPLERQGWFDQALWDWLNQAQRLG